MGETADRLFLGEAVELLCVTIPVDDRPGKVPHDDGVVGLLEQVRMLPQGSLGMLTLSDVVVRLQDGNGITVFVQLQRPPARHDHLRPVSLCVNELPFPSVSTEQRRRNLLERLGEARLQELMSHFADRLLALPSVEFLGAVIPVRDNVVHVADEDRVMREV